MKNKTINIGLSKEIVDLQDLCFKNFDTEAINESFDWAERDAIAWCEDNYEGAKNAK